MSEGMADIFFYGLFMDEEMLRAKGVHPRAARKAVVPGYRLKIGRRAMLSPQFMAQAFGMVFTLTEEEIRSLYSEPGLEMYHPEPVVAFFENGTHASVTTFNIRDIQNAGEINSEYAERLQAILKRLGLPYDYEALGRP